MRIRTVVITSSILALALLAATAATGAAASHKPSKKQPDLRITRLTMDDPSEDSLVAVDFAVRNLGSLLAGRSRSAVYISDDDSIGSDDLAEGVGAARLKPGKLALGSTDVDISLLEDGEYWIVVCADSTKLVKERNERNNCTISDDSFDIITDDEDDLGDDLGEDDGEFGDGLGGDDGTFDGGGPMDGGAGTDPMGDL